MDPWWHRNFICLSVQCEHLLNSGALLRVLPNAPNMLTDHLLPCGLCLTGLKSIHCWVEATYSSLMWQMTTVEPILVLSHIRMRILVPLQSSQFWVSQWLEISLHFTFKIYRYNILSACHWLLPVFISVKLKGSSILCMLLLGFD